jgi:translation initiation factor IF-1
LPDDCGDVELRSYSVGRLLNNRDQWRVSDVLTVEIWSYSVGRLVNNRDWWRVSDVLTVEMWSYGATVLDV